MLWSGPRTLNVTPVSSWKDICWPFSLLACTISFEYHYSLSRGKLSHVYFISPIWLFTFLQSFLLLTAQWFHAPKFLHLVPKAVHRACQWWLFSHLSQDLLSAVWVGLEYLFWFIMLPSAPPSSVLFSDFVQTFGGGCQLDGCFLLHSYCIPCII